MVIHFQFEIVLNKQFFLFEPVGQLGFELKEQHFEALQRFFDDDLFFGVQKLKEILLKRCFGLTFLDVDDISDKKGIFFGLHPNV